MRIAALAAALLVACSSASDPAAPPPSGDGGTIDLGPAPAGSTPAHPAEAVEAGVAATSYPTATDTTGPYVNKVVSFTPGKCAGFGQELMPNVVYGPPKGGGDTAGGLDVLSLGSGGEIVLSFYPNEIIDGVGADFIVFENAFFADGSTKPYAEPAEVSVSEDGVTWFTFPCTATQYPWGECAGWHSVSDTHDDSLDPIVVGGDPYDLTNLGIARARFVKIVDKTSESCPIHPPIPNTNGFDLDAVAAVHSLPAR